MLLTAKFQFVDQGPELENHYSQEDLVSNNTKSDVQEHKQDDAAVTSKRVEPSFDAHVSPAIYSATAAEHPPFLSPPTSNHETVLVHSPIKRRRTADEATPNYHSNEEHHGLYDPIRSQYRIYDKVFSPVSSEGNTYMPDQHHVPRVVEAEYRRMADSDAAYNPDSLLSPKVWKEEFYWPNRWTTIQCACLMRYYIEHLAPWVGRLKVFDQLKANSRSLTLATQQTISRLPFLNMLGDVHLS